MNMNAYSLKPIPILIEPAPVDPDLDGLPLTMAVDKCRRIIQGCKEAFDKAHERDTPRLVLAR